MKPFIASIIRHWLSVLAGALIGAGIISHEESKAFIEAAIPVLAGLILYVGPQLWSFKNISAVQAIAKRFGFKV